MSRKNRRNKPEPVPSAVPEPTPAPQVPAKEIQDLRERLEGLERARQQSEDPSPVAARHREKALWAAENTRTDSTDPCPACGLVGGEQRRIQGSMFRKSPTWACSPCTANAMITGYDTNVLRTYTEAETLDRLACLAAGMSRPTPSFRALADRYGLAFTLAKDNEGGDGAAWSHLGQRDLWAEVGAKALRRENAGFGVFPATSSESALYPKMVEGVIHDPAHPLGRQFALVPEPVEPPSAREVAARLAAEEAAIEAELTAQRHRAEVEAEKSAREAERDHINTEYRKAVRAQKALFASHRKGLRQARRQVLESADVRADFDAIVRSL